MKRIPCICLAIVLVLGLILAGCATSTPAPTASAPTTLAPASATPKTTAPPTSAPATSSPAVAPTSAAQQTWNLRFTTDQSPVIPYTIFGNIPWFKKIEEVTQGRVKVTAFYSSTLAPSIDMPTVVKNNIAQFGFSMLGTFPGQYPLSEVMALPFIATKSEDASRTLWKLFEEFPEIQAEYKGFKVITVWCTDPYPLITINKPVRTLDDIKGLKIRSAGTPMIEMTKMMGAVPLTMPMPDTYLALQKGLMDGMWASHEAILGYRLYEASNYFTFLPSCTSPKMIIMNQQTWDSFPPDVQKQIWSVCGEAASVHYATKVFDDAVTRLWDELKKLNTTFPKEYITLKPEEKDKFIAVGGKPVWDKWINDWKSRGPTQKILDRALELEKQYTK